MRMIAATVNPGNNFEMTVKKSENITKTDFKHELKQKMESNNQEAPKKIENINQDVNKESKSLKPKEQLVKENVEVTDSVEKTKSSNEKNIKNFKGLQLESNFHGKKIKNSDKKKSIETEAVKNKTESQDNENIQVSQLIQTQVQNDNVKLINKELTSSDNETEDVKLVKDLKVKTPDGCESKEVDAQNILTEKDVKSSKNFNVEDKKITKSEKNKKSENEVKVTDLRSNTAERTAVKEADTRDVTQSQSISDLNLEVEDSAENSSERTIVLGTTEISAEGDGGKSQAPVMKEATSILKQQLKDFGNSEIVKQTRFILKDNNVGEIRLILKPEALGEVKINLNLNENSLAGQIVVENSSVREVFQENLNSLSAALEKEGFDKADLNLSLSDKGQREEQQERERNKQYFSERLKRFDDNGQVVRYGLPTVGINLTA